MATPDQLRKDRLAAALRENLRKRKDQNRDAPTESDDQIKKQG
jgi:hypothetical protein